MQQVFTFRQWKKVRAALYFYSAPSYLYLIAFITSSCPDTGQNRTKHVDETLLINIKKFYKYVYLLAVKSNECTPAAFFYTSMLNYNKHDVLKVYINTFTEENDVDTCFNIKAGE